MIYVIIKTYSLLAKQQGYTTQFINLLGAMMKGVMTIIGNLAEDPKMIEGKTNPHTGEVISGDFLSISILSTVYKKDEKGIFIEKATHAAQYAVFEENKIKDIKRILKKGMKVIIVDAKIHDLSSYVSKNDSLKCSASLSGGVIALLPSERIEVKYLGSQRKDMTEFDPEEDQANDEPFVA